MSLERALAWLDPRAAEMEALLRELVEIPSHTPDVAGNDAAAARWLDATLALGGGALAGETVRSSSSFGRHARVSTEAAERGGAVLLLGHHDTVFPTQVFAGYREDGPLLRGPGVLDMKGGLVVISFALGALAEAGLLARVPLRAVSVSDEEVGSPESRALVAEASRGAACALVFESGRTNDLIVTRRKGTGGLTVVAHGKAAHAGNVHHEGRNAIWALARFVDGAQQLTDYARGVTVNVGKIAGGIGKNTVPDRAEALVDLRFVERSDGEALIAALRERAATAAVEGTSIEMTGGLTRAPLHRTDASAALAAEYGACQRACGLGGDESPLLGGGSDANTAAALGVPAIDGLGPRGKGFHTVDEFIERSSLVPKAAALVRFLALRAV
jgi:glutamate carboxypeptidase